MIVDTQNPRDTQKIKIVAWQGCLFKYFNHNDNA